MPLTSQRLFQLTTIRTLVIDCRKAGQQPEISAEVERLLSWMQDHGRDAHMRVTLKFATANIFGRKLKSRLQSLGCIVTMKTAY